jgi:hypothetical protein
MELESTAFFVVWVIVASIIIFGLFTKKGRSKSIEIQFGARVVKERGVISEESVLMGKQIVSLYECEKDSTSFFVLEVKRTAPFGFSYTYLKIDENMLKQFQVHSISSRESARIEK